MDSKFRASVMYNGQVFWAPGFKWVTACSMNLQFFPFDTQVCRVEFVNWIYSAASVVFITDTVLTTELDPNDAWELANTSASYFTMSAAGDEDFQIPVMYFEVALKRNPGYFIVNMLIPVMLISMLSALVFLLPAEAGEKISMSTTVFLSYTVVLLMVSEITPRGGSTTPIISKQFSNSSFHYQ